MVKVRDKWGPELRQCNGNEKETDRKTAKEWEFWESEIRGRLGLLPGFHYG
jgi:hypothetical protein